MRLSGFVAFNTPLVLLSLFTRNQTPLFNTAIQWANQTYNAGMNYGNRNASSTLTNSDLAKSYSAAVGVSCSIAFVSRTILAVQLQKLKGPKLIIANAALNYFAAAFAGAANLIMMRQKELKDGINVQSEKGEKTYGKSVLAAQRAVKETALSRFVLPLPVLFFPAIANYGLVALGLIPKNLVAAKLLEASLCVCSLSVALPMSIALFQQRSSA